MQNKTPATTFGYIMALLSIIIRTDNICFDDGSQKSLRDFSSRTRISLLYVTMESRNQKRKCFHEENNLFDMFAIRVCDDVKIVGHLQMKIPRPTKCLLDSGAVFTVELISTNYRRSPLIQGSLEIPAKVTVKLRGLEQ